VSAAGAGRRPATLEHAVRAAVAAVCDPEYPDLTIEDLGILETVAVDEGGAVAVGLVPTMLGCPALDAIEADVVAAARAAGATAVDVTFLASPRWAPERIRPSARQHLARDYTIALRGPDGTVICPVCGGRRVEERPEFGPSLCRSLAWCPDCRNPVEVVRRGRR
jgi:ring-1,2-phenylacetyl-CoA epoxidase subunit PaaD